MYGVNLVDVITGTFDAVRHVIGAKGLDEKMTMHTVIREQSFNGLRQAEDLAMMRVEVPYSTWLVYIRSDF